MLDKIKDIISEILGIEKADINENTSFVQDLGADSLDLFQIITAIEGEFGVEFDIEKADEIITVGDAIKEIERLSGR